MESGYSMLRTALQFVCGENTHVCRLCFASTEQNEICVLDLVTINKPYLEGSLTILEMLNTINIPDEPLLPHSLCGECATAVINNYLFIMLCKSVNDKWKNALDTLEDCLSHSEAINTCAKTVYLTIGEMGNKIFTTRQATGLSRTTAIKKLTLLARQYYSKETRHDLITAPVCAMCGEQFNSMTCLDKHMKSHRNVKDHNKLCCPQCARWFASKVHLQEHVERAHWPKTFPCLQCPSMFGSERMVKRHVALSHQEVVCKLCLLRFPSRKDLRVHLDKHEVNKCTECHKTFQNKQVYKRHLEICGKKHRDVAYFCDICQRGYRTKNSLRTHIKTDHGFGKTYSCKWCRKKFDAVSRLKNHIVTHTKERNFYCERCGDRFVTQPALTTHIRRHTGEKPYACDLCEEKFLSASRRSDHKRRKHIGPQLECTTCHVKFVTKHQLKKHEARHNNPHSKLYVPLQSFQ